MKKHNVSTLFKNKGFYVLLFVGLIAIAAVATMGVKVSKNNKKNNLVDLNTPSELNVDVADNANIEDESENAVNNDAANSDHISDVVIGDYTNDELLEYDAYNNVAEQEQIAKQENTDETENTTAKENQTTEVAENTNVEEAVQNEPEDNKEDQAETEESVSVMQPSASTKNLAFNKDSVMSWPVAGNIIMNYKTDGVIYYATLGEWKYNPAIVISSEVGTNVKAAAKGIVNSIEKDDELGTKVTMDVGNDYQIVYAQLADVTCNVGDMVNRDSVFGKVADPTKYYSIEGSNLYLQVLHKGEPVNPMLFLSGEE